MNHRVTSCVDTYVHEVEAYAKNASFNWNTFLGIAYSYGKSS